MHRGREGRFESSQLAGCVRPINDALERRSRPRRSTRRARPSRARPRAHSELAAGGSRGHRAHLDRELASIAAALGTHGAAPRTPRTRGVFATRSPDRPESDGLSSVRLVRIDGCNLHVHGIDLIDARPFST